MQYFRKQIGIPHFRHAKRCFTRWLYHELRPILHKLRQEARCGSKCNALQHHPTYKPYHDQMYAMATAAYWPRETIEIGSHRAFIYLIYLRSSTPINTSIRSRGSDVLHSSGDRLQATFRGVRTHAYAENRYSSW